MTLRNVKTPKLWRHLERHPLSAAYADLTGPRWQAMVDDVRQGGFDAARPIVLHEGKVLDGWQRLRACLETEQEPVFAELGDQDPEQYVSRHNDNRRHESADEALRRIEERRRRVREARAEGKSTRQIAEQEEISQRQVRRDLKAPEDPGEAHASPDCQNSSESKIADEPKPSPAPSPTVKGRDGKTYRADRPAPAPKPAPPAPTAPPAVAEEEPPEFDEPAPVPKPGTPLRDTKRLIDLYGQMVREVDRVMKGTVQQRNCMNLLGSLLAEIQTFQKTN